ncbi:MULTISPECIES: hypothetical protein [unclassified Mucilaginibacter]|uniref:hypothetical protein n=1 Tax=unclassified Mucilaginibacter TaxID=2617802 RepID=UPI002AC8A2E2|nr:MULTISPECIES: hypothetical protein [unclassified Mucilaginibacter]MEB0262970.1 hypothetical protein [Mucilaginibacter sp. 10I4]MEB0277535.1 hypothetical protein [Mucilaginibacter sp. 10B2]MEB0299450.1 hypothetical protein [Mucilaginibacter sp. 5C4]WPX24835.1 hypothetical protein RHM67_06095 [Mucilaginibacter sp. 5C4]
MKPSEQQLKVLQAYLYKTLSYRETYEEILDHVLTAIEVKRRSGDMRDIGVVFQDVVDTDFGGYRGIEELALKQVKIYQKHIGATFSKTLRSYFNWKVLTFTFMVSALAYTLPNNKPMHVVFLIAIFLLAITPLIYTCILISRNVKTIKGKRSLLNGHLIAQTIYRRCC